MDAEKVGGVSMNIFVLDENPVTAAKYMDDVRLPKMCVESAQMMAASLRRHGATDEQMPLTKPKWITALDNTDTMWFVPTPYKGGYKHHPCTVWAGDSRANFQWLARHAQALLTEYSNRFDKVHACSAPIHIMSCIDYIIPEGGLTQFALAMPDEYRPEPIDDEIVYHAYPKFAVQAYRSYYKSKQYSKGGVRYVRADVPTWWEVTA
jgi:hypothetical protein